METIRRPLGKTESWAERTAMLRSCFDNLDDKHDANQMYFMLCLSVLEAKDSESNVRARVYTNMIEALEARDYDLLEMYLERLEKMDGV